MTSTFNKNVQCFKILHPENETGFHNLLWIALKRSCLFWGLVALVSVTSNQILDITSILKVHKQLSAILVLNYENFKNEKCVMKRKYIWTFIRKFKMSTNFS